jgi:hypothetical protein
VVYSFVDVAIVPDYPLHLDELLFEVRVSVDDLHVLLVELSQMT